MVPWSEKISTNYFLLGFVCHPDRHPRVESPITSSTDISLALLQGIMAFRDPFGIRRKFKCARTVAWNLFAWLSAAWGRDIQETNLCDLKPYV